MYPDYGQIFSANDHHAGCSIFCLVPGPLKVDIDSGCSDGGDMWGWYVHTATANTGGFNQPIDGEN